MSRWRMTTVCPPPSRPSSGDQHGLPKVSGSYTLMCTCRRGHRRHPAERLGGGTEGPDACQDTAEGSDHECGVKLSMQDAQQRLLSGQGKHMWLEFDEGPALMLHFGMTGAQLCAGLASLLSRATKTSFLLMP